LLRIEVYQEERDPNRKIWEFSDKNWKKVRLFIKIFEFSALIKKREGKKKALA